jgi:DNA-binding MarR family transcriptional regulator
MPAKPLQLIPDLHRATHRIGIFLDGLGISQGEGHILSHLAASGDATVASLHRALSHRRSTLTSILDRLVKRGYVARETDPRDRRSFIVRLSKEGRRAASQVHLELNALEQQALRGFSARRRRSLIELLQSLESVAEQAAKRRS